VLKLFANCFNKPVLYFGFVVNVTHEHPLLFTTLVLRRQPDKFHTSHVQAFKKAITFSFFVPDFSMELVAAGVFKLTIACHFVVAVPRRPVFGNSDKFDGNPFF